MDGFFDNISGILTGGLQGALDVELEKRRADIANLSTSGDTRRVVVGDDRVAVIGQPAVAQVAPGIPTAWLIAGAVAVAVVVFLVNR